MAFIGALIGGFTNHLAIKMLFRPHEAKYIGSWRIPFTPGLIPKRRDELAVQLGKTVTKYLLTAETLKKKLLTPSMQEKAEQFLQSNLEKHVLHSEKTLHDWLALIGASNVPSVIEGKVLDVVDVQLQHIEKKITGSTVEELLPAKWNSEIEESIPNISRYIIERGEKYFESEEGKEMLRKLIDDFLASKGTFGNMVQMLFGESETVVSKVQKEVLKFLSSGGTAHLVQNIIHNEWVKLRQRPMAEIIENFDLPGLMNNVKIYAKKELAIESRFDKTLQHYWPTSAQWAEQNLIPVVTSFAFQQAGEQLEVSLQKLKIDEMVKEQVDTFPVAVLEDLVLGISRREFKMITVLGAVLGGTIGIVQGIIVFVTNLT